MFSCYLLLLPKINNRLAGGKEQDSQASCAQKHQGTQQHDGGVVAGNGGLRLHGLRGLCRFLGIGGLLRIGGLLGIGGSLRISGSLRIGGILCNGTAQQSIYCGIIILSDSQSLSCRANLKLQTANKVFAVVLLMVTIPFASGV